MASELEYDEDFFETKVCTADWIDGLSIDILKYCEIGPLTAAQKEKLWNECTDISLIRACDECFMIKTGEFDEIPGQSTEYFSVMTDDEDQLKKEIREQIRQVIG